MIILVAPGRRTKLLGGQISEDFSKYILLYSLKFEPYKMFKTIKLKSNYLKEKQK